MRQGKMGTYMKYLPCGQVMMFARDEQLRTYIRPPMVVNSF